MKKLYGLLALAFLCTCLVACAGARGRVLPSPSDVDRTAAIIDIVETERSKMELPETSAVTSAPHYYEVVAVGTTAATTTPKPKEPEKAQEYFTVKFVDTDGYTAVSVQTVPEGEDAVPPVMPQSRGELIFRGWDRDYTDIHGGRIIKAIYQKEWLSVRFFDMDATLVSEQKVRYGESADAPAMKDRGNFLFDGWSELFQYVTDDMDIYALYYAPEQRAHAKLTDLYSLLDVAQNSLGIPTAAYYRGVHNSLITIGKKEFAGNILYGNFCDTFPIEGYGFTSIAGTLLLRGDPTHKDKTFSLRLYIEADGEQIYYTELTGTNTTRNFSVDFTGVKNLTVRLEPYANGSIYYVNPVFVGGLADTVLYQN